MYTLLHTATLELNQVDQVTDVVGLGDVNVPAHLTSYCSVWNCKEHYSLAGCSPSTISSALGVNWDMTSSSHYIQ